MNNSTTFELSPSKLFSKKNENTIFPSVIGTSEGKWNSLNFANWEDNIRCHHKNFDNSKCLGFATILLSFMNMESYSSNWSKIKSVEALNSFMTEAVII